MLIKDASIIHIGSGDFTEFTWGKGELSKEISVFHHFSNTHVHNKAFRYSSPLLFESLLACVNIFLEMTALHDPRF